jgi:hypothetical protein
MPSVGLLQKERKIGNENPPLLHNGAAGEGHWKQSAQIDAWAPWSWVGDGDARAGITQKRANN